MLIAKPNKMKQTGLCVMVLLTNAEVIFATLQLKLPPSPQLNHNSDLANM